MTWKPIRSVDYIVVHCAATRPDMDIGAAEIRRLHLKRGWLDIGYHYVIRRDGTIEYGRETNVPGAHARGYNHLSLGICLVGGVSQAGPKKKLTVDEWFSWYSKNYASAPAQDNFTDDQYDALWGLIKGLKVAYPDAEVLGHRDLPNVNKACPSFDVREKWEEQQ